MSMIIRKLRTKFVLRVWWVRFHIWYREMGVNGLAALIEVNGLSAVTVYQMYQPTYVSQCQSLVYNSYIP